VFVSFKPEKIKGGKTRPSQPYMAIESGKTRPINELAHISKRYPTFKNLMKILIQLI